MNSIVIGSGFGGIAAALRLKAKNHDVTLVEKHQDLGGRARVFKKKGFVFDGGPTVLRTQIPKCTLQPPVELAPPIFVGAIQAPIGRPLSFSDETEAEWLDHSAFHQRSIFLNGRYVVGWSE